MNSFHHPARRLGTSLGLLAALSIFSTTAMALPNASWDVESDDNNVLVEGVSASDYMDGKRALNGFMRDSLTQGYADYLLTAWEWTLQNKLSPADRQAFFSQLSKTWMQGKYSSEAWGAFKPLLYRSGIDAYLPNEQLDTWTRTLRRKTMMQEVRKEAKADPENGRFLLALYDKYNPALAPGEPRLTRTTTNALTDRVVFMINEVIGKPAAKATPQLQKRIADQTAALWPKLSPARREELLKMETDFQYMEQEGWKWKTEATREDIRIAWGEELQSSFPAVKPMYLLRKKRLETAKRQSAARWAKMSPEEKQMALMQLQNQAQMNQMMITSMHNMQVQNHVTNMNIIENMKTTPEFVYSVR